MEYCSSIWNPNYKCHIERLEKIQKKYLYFLTIHQGKRYQLRSYDDRLIHFGFDSLEVRRWITDQVLLFKIITGLIDCPQLLGEINFRVPRQNSRPTNFKPFFLKYCRTNLGTQSIFHRLCDEFNKFYKSSDKIDLLADSLISFKKSLYAFKSLS